MRRRLNNMKKLGLLFVICMLALSAAGTADAFLPKIDAGKGASGVSNIVQKAKAQAEKAMQWISNSKMGKFVGDGISAAKDGMSFMKEQYNNAMKLYGQAQDAIESVKDSKEYQMAMISKEIAEYTAKIASLGKDRLEIEEDIEQQIEIARETYNSKQKDWVSNMTLNPDSDEEDNTGLSALEAELNAQISKLEAEQESRTEEIDNQLEELAEKVADLTKELEKLASDGEGKPETDPAEAVQSSQEEIFLKEGEVSSLKNREKLLENRYQERRDVIYKTYQQAVENRATITGSEKKADMTKELSPSMPGESEGGGIHVEVLIHQAEMMRQYVDLLLLELEMETTAAAAQLTDITPGEKLDKINLCKYSLDYGESKSGLSSLKDTFNSVKEGVSNTVEKAKDTASDLKEKAADVKQKVDEAKEVYEASKELINTGKEAGTVIKSMTGVEGMI